MTVPDTLELWRQASLHLDLGAFVAQAAAWLETRVPLRRLEVWRLRRDGRSVVPFTAGDTAGADGRTAGPRELDIARGRRSRTGSPAARRWPGALPTRPLRAPARCGQIGRAHV